MLNSSFCTTSRVVGAVAFSAMSVGQMGSFAPDYGKAKDAAARIFHIFTSEPTIDPSTTGGKKMVGTLFQLS